MASPRCLISLAFSILMCLGLSSAHRVLLDSMATKVHKPKSGFNDDNGGGTLEGSTGGMGRGHSGTGANGGGFSSGGGAFPERASFGNRCPIGCRSAKGAQTERAYAGLREKQDNNEPMTEMTRNEQDSDVKITPTEKEKQDGELMNKPTQNKQDGEVKIAPKEKEKQDDDPMTESTHKKQNRHQMFKNTNGKEMQDNESKSIDDKKRADIKHMSNKDVMNNEPVPPGRVVDMQEYEEATYSEPMFPESVEVES